METTCGSCGKEFDTKTDCFSHACEEFEADDYEYRNAPNPICTVDGAGPADRFEVLNHFSRLSLKQCWKSEPKEFIPWLAENPDPLEGALDTNLRDIRTEIPAGRYRADILAENTDGERLVIETQVKPSDHDHLGKLLTYGSYLEADELVWVAKSFSKGHVRTAIKLTERCEDTNLTLVTFDATWVGEYRPVVMFETVWE